MTRVLAALAVLLLLTACSASKPVSCPAPITHNIPYETKVPVYVKATPPAELMRPYKPTEYPKFVVPTDPEVRYGLTELDWQRLQVILRTFGTRDQAWRAWAKKYNGASSK